MTDYGEKQRSMSPLFVSSFLSGSVLIGMSPALPSIMEEMKLSDSMGGLLASTYLIGTMVSIIALNFLFAKWTSRFSIILYSSISAFALLGLGLSKSFFLAAIANLVVGFSNGALLTYPGMVASSYNRHETDKMVNFLYGTLAIGIIIWSPIEGAIISSGASWRMCFYIPAAANILLLILAYAMPPPDIPDRSNLNIIKVIEFLRHDFGLFAGIASSIFVYVAAEHIINVWGPKYFQAVFPFAGIITASIVPSMFWMGLALGRMIAGKWLCNYPVRLLIIILALSSWVIWLSVIFANSPITAIIGIALLGLAFSAIWPLLISCSNQFPGQGSSMVFSLFVAIGALGGATGTNIFGVLADFMGFRLALGICSFFIPTIVVIVVKRLQS